MVSFTHEQNSICSQKQLNDIAHEHTIICRQLFAGHVVGSRPMKRKKHLRRMIISVPERMRTSFFSKLDPLFSVFSPALSELDTNLILGRVLC